MRQWTAVASSADALKLAATVRDGSIWTSTDAGVTWTERASTQTWTGVASSADGQKLIAAAYNSRLWTSTDAGATWTQRGITTSWYGVASSADGNVLVATPAFDYLQLELPPPDPVLARGGVVGRRHEALRRGVSQRGRFHVEGPSTVAAPRKSLTRFSELPRRSKSDRRVPTEGGIIACDTPVAGHAIDPPSP